MRYELLEEKEGEKRLGDTSSIARLVNIRTSNGIFFVFFGEKSRVCFMQVPLKIRIRECIISLLEGRWSN